MLAHLYIEALLTDSRLADQVWELRNARLVSDELAAMAWWLMAFSLEQTQENSDSAQLHWQDRGSGRTLT